MAHAVQTVVTESVEKQLEGWKNIGVKFDGATVKEVPRELEFTIDMLNKLEEGLQPDYRIAEKSIASDGLSLFAVPKKLWDPKLCIFSQDIYVSVRLRPMKIERGVGYKGEASFNLRTKQFPNYAPDVLNLDSSTGPIGDETKSKTYEWSQSRGDFEDWDYSGYRLKEVLKNLKIVMDTALAIREYESRRRR